MTRPKPHIIAEYNRGYKTDQVLQAKTVYALLYCNEPINLRTVDELTGKKYYTVTTGVSRPHLDRLAHELNQLHNTTHYQVKEMK